jgi:hypothetical protein
VKLTQKCGPCGCEAELDGADEAAVRRAGSRWRRQHGPCVRAAQRDLGRLMDRERSGVGFAATSPSPDRASDDWRYPAIGPRRVEA